jgi:TolA-binding protein
MKKSRLNIPTLIILSASITTTITPAWADGLKVNSNISIAETNKVSEEQISEMNERIDVNEDNIESIVNKDKVSEEQISEMNERIDVNEDNIESIVNKDKVSEEQISEMDRRVDVNAVRIESIVNKDKVSEEQISEMDRRVDVNAVRIDNIENREVVGELVGNLQYWDGDNWNLIAPPEDGTDNTKVLKYDRNGFEWVAEQTTCRLWNFRVFNDAYVAALSNYGSVRQDSEGIRYSYRKYEQKYRIIKVNMFLGSIDNETLKYESLVIMDANYIKTEYYISTNTNNDIQGKVEIVSQGEFEACIAIKDDAVDKING